MLKPIVIDWVFLDRDVRPNYAFIEDIITKLMSFNLQGAFVITFESCEMWVDVRLIVIDWVSLDKGVRPNYAFIDIKTKFMSFDQGVRPNYALMDIHCITLYWA